jgi:hypothetical protein
VAAGRGLETHAISTHEYLTRGGPSVGGRVRIQQPLYRYVQKYHKALKINGTTKVLVYADDVHLLANNTENSVALSVSSNEVGLEIRGHKAKYNVTSSGSSAKS